jgi:hypothetical protein
MIEKDVDPQTSRLDGFDAKRLYQMIPEQDARRGFKITNKDERVHVRIEPEGIARFDSPVGFDPVLAHAAGHTVGHVGAAHPTHHPLDRRDRNYFRRLEPRAVGRFNLFGEKAGKATLVVYNLQDKSLASLRISVKAPFRKTYSLCLLHDMRHRSPWLPPNDPTKPSPPPADNVVRPMMETVKKCYSLQANLLLSELRPQLFEVNINDKNLSNKRDQIVLDALTQPENKKIWEMIVDRTQPEARGADFVIYFTWDIRVLSQEIVGMNIGKPCFIEFHNNSIERAVRTAHELGHGLGLNDRRDVVLMAGDDNSRSFELAQNEIDTVNPSGTQIKPPSKRD